MSADPAELESPAELDDVVDDGHGPGPSFPAPVLPPLPPSGEAVARTFSELAAIVAPSFLGAVRRMTEIVERITADLRAAGYGAPVVPTDPRERALYLVRNRNTGPRVHADPRRNRR